MALVKGERRNVCVISSRSTAWLPNRHGIKVAQSYQHGNKH